MPGLSKEGWRDRNSVIKVGKAAASNLMSVVCGEQKDIIEILVDDANGLKLSAVVNILCRRKCNIIFSTCSR